MEKTKSRPVHLVWSILFFLISNIVLSPASYFLDMTLIQPIRGPFFEEALKYALLIFFLRKNISFSSLNVAVAIGFAETINNVVVGYYLNFSGIKKIFESEGAFFGIFILFIPILIKLASSILVHYLTFKAGMLFFYRSLYIALFVSILIHLAINFAVLSIWS